MLRKSGVDCAVFVDLRRVLFLRIPVVKSAAGVILISETVPPDCIAHKHLGASAVDGVQSGARRTFASVVGYLHALPVLRLALVVGRVVFAWSA